MSVTTQRTLEDSRVDDENIVHNDVNKMLKLTRLAASLSAAAITVFCFSGLASADEKLVEIGQNTTGNPMFLDLTTIRGTSYKMLEQHGDGMMEISVSAKCAENRMVITGQALYNAEGYKIDEDRTRREMSPAPNSVAAKS